LGVYPQHHVFVLNPNSMCDAVPKTQFLYSVFNKIS